MPLTTSRFNLLREINLYKRFANKKFNVLYESKLKQLFS